MPTTPKFALRYPAATDPADVPLDMGNLATDVDNALGGVGGSIAATPPASPVEGQIWHYPAGNGVVWQFRYNAGSASPNKWEFVGGAPLVGKSAPNVNIGASVNTWTNVVGSTLTVPRAGDYQFFATLEAQSPSSGPSTVLVAVYLGTAASVLPMQGWQSIPGASQNIAISMPKQTNPATAAQACGVAAQANTANTVFFSVSWEFVPVRVA